MMLVKGKLISAINCSVPDFDEWKAGKKFGQIEAAIEFPPVDVAKIKEGDEVWVKVTARRMLAKTEVEKPGFLFTYWYDPAYKTSIVAHFPAPELPKPKQEIEELRELDLKIFNDPGSNFFEGVLANAIKNIILTINEVIRELNGRATTLEGK